MKIYLMLLLMISSGRLLNAQGDYQKGLSYYQQKQYDKAIAEFEAIIEQQPEYEFGHRILGFCYLQTRQWDRAIKAFQKSIELKPDAFPSYSGLALAYFNTGRFSEVVRTLNKAQDYAKLPKDLYTLYRTRGSAAFNLQDFSAAIRDLEKATAIQRGDTDDLLQLGISYYHSGRLDDAEKTLQQVKGLSPDNSQVKSYLSKIRFDKGVAAISEGRYQEAANLLRAHSQENPEDADGWFNLGLAFIFTKNLEAAEQAFLRSVQIQPDRSEAHSRLGYIYEKNKRYKKSLEEYQKAYNLAPQQDTKESIERIQKRIEQANQG